MGAEAVEGMVRVVFSMGTRNLVSGLMEFPEGSQRLKLPSTIFSGIS